MPKPFGCPLKTEKYCHQTDFIQNEYVLHRYDLEVEMRLETSNKMLLLDPDVLRDTVGRRDLRESRLRRMRERHDTF
jgi:hypothetical protein